MEASNIVSLATRIVDIAAIVGGDILHVEMGSMADGSWRSYALVTMYSCGQEEVYRITSPVPWNAPEWASDMNYWAVEVRTGESWLELETERSLA